MRVTLLAFGTRGDVQPMLALGAGLRDAGFDVSLAAGRNSEAWVRAHGLSYKRVNVDIEAMMRSPGGARWVEGGRLRELPNMTALFREATREMGDSLSAACADADVVLTGLTSDWAGLTEHQARGIPMISVQLQPSRPTWAGSATLIAPAPRSNSPLNYALTMTAFYGLYTIFAPAMNRDRRARRLPTLKAGGYAEAMWKIPTLHGLSQHVVPFPADYPAHFSFTGYWFLDAPGYMPPAPLARFLADGPPPVYIGFGSMTFADPAENTQMIIEAVAAAGVRAVVNRGWAMLDAPDTPHIHWIDSAPHDWLFPRMRAVVHHGGAGTTGAACRAGVPQIVTPHFADQPFWGRRMFELGVAHRPVRKRRLNAPTLARAIRAAVDDPALAENARALARNLQSENGVARAVELIKQHLNL
jgi:sterol 3beta-glucosyltransferase